MRSSGGAGMLSRYGVDDSTKIMESVMFAKTETPNTAISAKEIPSLVYHTLTLVAYADKSL